MLYKAAGLKSARRRSRSALGVHGCLEGCSHQHPPHRLGTHSLAARPGRLPHPSRRSCARSSREVPCGAGALWPAPWSWPASGWPQPRAPSPSRTRGRTCTTAGARPSACGTCTPPAPTAPPAASCASARMGRWTARGARARTVSARRVPLPPSALPSLYLLRLPRGFPSRDRQVWAHPSSPSSAPGTARGAGGGRNVCVDLPHHALTALRAPPPAPADPPPREP